jgi:hypothetical protein
MTLSGPLRPPEKPVVLQIQGIAEIDGKVVIRPAVPSEDMMQAFLYRHLVPSQELMVAVKKTKWPSPVFELPVKDPIKIPAGGTSRVRIKTPKRRGFANPQLQFIEPPAGLTIHDVSTVEDGLSFQLKSNKNEVQAGFKDNLIIEVFAEFTPRNKKGENVSKKRRVSMGLLPAIPIEIISQ